MITFACSHCGMKFQVQDEFGGRSARCPTCKQPLTVPLADQTQAHFPGDSIKGPASSVAQAGIESAVTLGHGEARPGQKPVHALLTDRARNGERYLIEGEIARGGMGAVLRAIDCDIRREVAVKFMLDDRDPQKKVRFIEEAQITGQLEHPNIVPIHELGVDAHQRFFFSMKMVRGKSLAQVLDGLRQEPRAAEKEWPLSRLLTVFVNVCNALAYAHSRGVVHRDLKPANIMVGDFGAVYVMDWGLAKVVKERSPVSREMAGPPPIAPVTVPMSDAQSVSASRSRKVETNREAEADLTQDGAVLGTPIYMPPEQAAGRIQEIDERSDIYSLGAILYELLTLQPPIDQTGGRLPILLRVAQGEIAPPGQRARTGRVPKELAAVAMKALAKDPRDRYPAVEALRRDVELYQEGRSVSARQDTTREVLWKLVKRNRGASLATAAALLVIAVILGFSINLINDGRLQAEDERNRAEGALEAYRQEQQAKRAQAKASVPVVLEAARLAVERRRFPEALAQTNVAVDYDPDHAGARLFRARMRIAVRDFPGARADLERLLELRPEDASGARLLRLCRQARADDARSHAAFAAAFLDEGEVALAAHMVATREGQLAVYRKRLDDAWPGGKAGDTLTMDKAGNCALEIYFKKPGMTDLEPLRGLPLTRLTVHDRHLGAPWRKLRDLDALRSLPLEYLQLDSCVYVTDLTPLQGLPLRELHLTASGPIGDLKPLQGLKLTAFSLALWPPGGHGAPQYVHVLQPIELNVLRKMPLTSLSLNGQNVGRLSFVSVSDLPDLTHLELASSWNFDLTRLQGLKLKRLNLNATGVRDLTPLEGLPLENLSLESCTELGDLGPLSKVSSLKVLDIGRTGVRKLSPLAKLKLDTIALNSWVFPREEMEVLRQMTSLREIAGSAPTAFWKKYDAKGFGK